LIELASLVRHSVPKHVKRVSIFQDFNTQLENAMPILVCRDTQILATLNLALAKAFAAKSHHLERLSISYMIDAQQFIASCQQLPCTWNLLQSLTLTSSTLVRKAHHQDIYTLLRNASSVALKMPQLKPMVLWNSEPGHACAFIYLRHAADATLAWRGTWDLKLSDDVVESWGKVAPGPCFLRLKREALRDVDIRSHGDAIHHLRLPDGVVDSESLCQIRHERMMQEWLDQCICTTSLTSLRTWFFTST
jgi:hypothetical protein